MKTELRNFLEARTEPREALLLLIIFNIFWLPSLAYGFLWDDATHVTFSFDEAWQRSLDHAFRPLYLFSFPVISNIFGLDPWIHRIVNLGLINLTMICLYQSLPKPSRVTLLGFSVVFTHPALLFPVTWIAARNDAMLLALVALAILQLRRGKTGMYPLVLSFLCKVPFVLHGLFFMVILVVRRRLVTAAIVMTFIVLMIWVSFESGYRSQIDSHSLVNKLGADWMTVMLARGAKGVEAIILVFVPFPAFYHLPLWGFSIFAYVLLWSVLVFWGNVRLPDGLTSVSIQTWMKQYGAWILALGLLSLPPLVFNSQLRVVAVAAVLIQFGLLLLCRDLSSRAHALVALLALNILGLMQNYRLSDTGYMMVGAVPTAERVDAYCQTNRVPISHWDCERNLLVGRIMDSMSRPTPKDGTN